MSDYLKVVYDEKTHPYTEYPEKLCQYLFKTFQMSEGMKFLEAGCGRGEFLMHFNNLNLEIYGIDLSPEASKYKPDGS